VDGQALEERFSRLYSISHNKDSMVGDLVDWEGRRNTRCHTWNLNWRRERFEWEKYLKEQMKTMISNVNWNVNGQDRLVWAGDENQEYTFKFGYSILNSEDLMQTSEIFQLLWSTKITPSAIVCAWRLLLDRLPTRYNLARRGVQVGNMQCSLCLEGLETAQHLFNTCIMAQQVWDQCDR